MVRWHYLSLDQSLYLDWWWMTWGVEVLEMFGRHFVCIVVGYDFEK
jgi:hypothetical protein